MGHGTDTDPGRRLSDCVTSLLRDHPFFGSLVLRMPLVADPSRKTLASDGLTVRYNPEWVNDTAADLIRAALARVALACGLKHHTRRGERVPERWQRASQFVTHGLLRDAGFTLPPKAQAWDGLSVEQAYERLSETSNGAGSNGTPPPGGGVQNRNRPPSLSGTAGARDRKTGAGGANGGDARAGNATTQPGPGKAADSSGSLPPGNNPVPRRSFDPSGTGEVLDASTRGPADGSPADSRPADGRPADGKSDRDRPASDGSAGRGPSAERSPAPWSEQAIAAEEQAWDEAMHQAANVAQAQGNVPGAVVRTLADAHRSRLDWLSLLRRFMLDTAENDYTWSVPNRRFIDSGLYLPAVRSEGMDAIALIVDSSGSVQIPALQRTWSEIRAIAAELRPERIYVLQVDTALHRVDEYGPDELPERLTVKGRGGTDFRPGFRWIEEQGIRLACCLYFTDMRCTRYPATEPDFPVMFVNTSRTFPDRYREPWGERIDLPFVGSSA